MKKNSNIKLARSLRRNTTEPEKILWFYLRKRSLKNFKFRRQYPIGKYIVDFISFEARLIIELDGSQHLASEERDARRDNWLMGEGFKVLRFYNNELLEHRERVLESIVDACEKHSPPSAQNLSPPSALQAPSPIEGEGHRGKSH
ncbi:MAG: endonuclease domain-containing protein [Pseudomonadota bacterium]